MSKNLLILERSTEELSIKKDNKGYILEGIFGEIGVRNKNNRIYDESEYLPQIQDLQEKIKSGKLLGELDHPQNFDISLKNVSHVIEDISYDNETKQVRGRIRLLNTDAGRQAQALVDDGIPLHISSRAAGAVESNGHVKIKKLFTYDLVADPGFANAELNRVNESFGFSNDSFVQIFEIDSPIPSDDRYNTKLKENNTNTNMDNVVGLEDFNNYSKHITEQINSIREELKSIKEGTSENTQVTEGDNSKMEEYINKVSSKMNEMFSYLKYVAENVNNLAAHNDSIVENVKAIQGYLDHVAEKSDAGICYAEEMGERINVITEHNDYLSKHVNNLAQFGDYLSEGLENVVGYTEYLKEGIETVGQYGDYTAENVKGLKNKFAKLASLNEDDAKDIEKKIMDLGKPKELPLEKGHELVGEEEKTKKVEENVQTLEVYKNEITSKLAILIESAKKQTVDVNSNLHFLKFANESKRNEFESLNESTKTLLVEAFKDKKYTNSTDVTKVWESVISPAQIVTNYITNMPDQYRDKWTNLSTVKKNQIIAESNYHKLETQYQIDNFWTTRDFREVQIDVKPLNETVSTVNENNNYLVNSDYMENFKNELSKKMGRY